MSFGISDKLKKLFGKTEELKDETEMVKAPPFVDSTGAVMTEEDFTNKSLTTPALENMKNRAPNALTQITREIGYKTPGGADAPETGKDMSGDNKVQSKSTAVGGD